jgi:hypothetical protein
MKVALLAVIGLIFGSMLGAVVGVGVGLAYTNLAGTSCFEGYCGMLVFITFMPAGAFLGGLSGAICLGWMAAHTR